MIVIKNNEVYSTEGKYVKNLKTNSTFKRSVVLPIFTEEDFIELDELPKYTEDEYREKVKELIAQKYSIEDEIALINNLKGDKDEYLVEYREYMDYRKECKTKAKEILNNR